MQKIQRLSILSFLLLLQSGFAQPEKPNAVEIYEQIQKLNFLGKVLYLAAHPDDENTKLITYFSNYYHAETAYLSLTRGDGGQNLIGSELREKLGVIRTHELIAARKIDDGKQFFTRANDFGFSKNPEETLRIWNKNEVLDDVLQVFNTFQPDIVINRFDHRTPGTTHGHHTASALLSLEAYEKADVKPKRVFLNTSWWFYGSEENFAKIDKTNLLQFNANVFYPQKGLSNHEISALSRSQHRSQGFGTMGTRGEETEYLEILHGDLPPIDNLFAGIDTSWNRIKDGNEIGKILNKVEQHFNFQNPAVHLPDLLKAYKLIQKLEDEHWKKIKNEQIQKVIEACSGLFLEAVVNVETASPNDEISINFEAINRSNATIKLLSVIYMGENYEFATPLISNKKISKSEKIKIVELKEPFATPFWLRENPTVGMYQVFEKHLRILPETDLYGVTFKVKINDEIFYFGKKIVYKINKPELGEVYTPFRVVPKFTVELPEKVSVFKRNETKEISVKVTVNQENLNGIISLNVPKNWKIQPENYKITESKTVVFKVTSPNNESNAEISAKVTSGNQTFDKELTEINYPHIPKQTLLLPAKAKFICLDIETKTKNIGYLSGAGDEVGKALENLGYSITYLSPTDLTSENLQKFDAVILGIRVFNVVKELQTKNKILFDYVKNGGNLIVQYNTSNALVTNEIAPFPLKISRDRVTEEDAEVRFLAPNHPVLNHPNKITTDDFKGWVQEQGLYYPNEWSSEFTPIISANDTSETPKDGALLIAKHGKGNYIYTGLSFFRELPEGVSGAFRLIVNLIELKIGN